MARFCATSSFEQWLNVEMMLHEEEAVSVEKVLGETVP